MWHQLHRNLLLSASLWWIRLRYTSVSASKKDCGNCLPILQGILASSNDRALNCTIFGEHKAVCNDRARISTREVWRDNPPWSKWRNRLQETECFHVLYPTVEADIQLDRDLGAFAKDWATVINWELYGEGNKIKTWKITLALFFSLNRFLQRILQIRSDGGIFCISHSWNDNSRSDPVQWSRRQLRRFI